MSQMKGLVGVGAAVFYHHQRSVVGCLLLAIVGVGIDVGQQLQPGGIGDAEVEEAFYNVILADGLTVLYQIVAQLLSGLLRTFTGHFYKGEHYEGQVALKLTARLLQLYHLLRHILSIQCLYGSLGCCHYLLFYLHTLNVKRVQRYTKK